MFEGKRVLIISPQPWGKMRISKHHYALEFKRNGAEVVYFCTFGHAFVSESKDGIDVVGYRFPWFYRLKFHAFPLYQIFLKNLMPEIKELREAWDLVFSFDIGGDFPLELWDARTKVYFPVDFPQSNLAYRSGKGADFVFSIADGILDEFESSRKFKIGHGVSEEFDALLIRDSVDSGCIRNVGYAGNLTRPDIDFDVLNRIVLSNTDVQFHFWGALDVDDSNLGGGGGADTRTYLKKLLEYPNVTAYGPVHVGDLVEGFAKMDAFLICYDPLKDQSRSLNYHKILEYFSSGKVVISNRVREYESSDLIAMASGYFSNEDLPSVFSDVCSNPSKWNGTDLCRARKEMAKQAAYGVRLRTLAHFLLAN